ncbi:MAG: sensor histidine kinase, partial [Ruminococcus sp.]|nr:sensor histidine kinase [Ruminococcus sp.]
MKYKPFLIGMLLSIALIVTALLSYTGNDKYEPDRQAAVAVGANEVYNLINSGDTKAAAERARQLSAEAAQKDTRVRSNSKTWVWILCGVGIVCINGVIAYVWLSIIKPFHKLERYADDLAAGKFDNGLDYERSNYFGKFTWAFDSMRREIIKARSCEREAIENNKTVIASLSHDLKTPVASISAYSEALVNGFYSDTEEMYSYLDVISKKCDEISKITGDMLVHAIGELDALKMSPEPLELSGFIETTVKETGT